MTLKTKKMDGPQKAAIFLMAMGDDFTREVIKGLNEHEVTLLGRRMAELENATIPVDTVRTIMDEFEQLSNEVSGVTGRGFTYLQNALVAAFGPEKAKPILESISQAMDTAAFSSLKLVDPGILADYLKGEHPQTIALVLAHLDHQKVAQVIKEMPEKLQPEIVFRIANLGMVPAGIIEDVDEVLKKEIQAMGSVESKRLGGIETVAEIMNQLDHNTENNIFSSLEEIDADLAESIRQKMFVFEDLINIDNRGIQAILKEITNEDLSLALKTASEGLKSHILKNMSSRAAEMLLEDMEVMGPVKLSDVEMAQQNIVRVARKLEASGKIVIGGKGGEDVLV
ncbi:MAG TPA: flagellar motor switch protein FliG [Deltaproteobacteria bacterium]|nr:flagellar motor switch protein FliG [Deltaproteobacteria bacterium]HPP80721.1 flagellar motor switch protein FliG [Deltaproteobacteria bacterium]